MLFYTKRFNAAVNANDKSPSANFLAANLNNNNIKLIENWDDLDLNVTIEGWMCKKKNPYEN